MDRSERTPGEGREVPGVPPHAGGPAPRPRETPIGPPRRIDLREEEIVARRNREQVGEVRVRTVVDDVPSRMLAELTHDEVVVERVPVNQEVEQRYGPWEEDGAQVIPVYEERIVLVKQLVLKEKVFVRRLEVTETRPIETSIRRERIEVDAPEGVVVQEKGPGPADESPVVGDGAGPRGGIVYRAEDVAEEDEPGPLERVVRKFLA